MASTTIATRRSGYFEVIEAGVVIGYYPISALSKCADRNFKDLPEFRANVRPSLPVYKNITYVKTECDPIQVNASKAGKCTALGIIRKDGYLSLLANGSGVLSYRLTGINGAVSPSPSQKTFLTEGYPIPSELGQGTAFYGGGFFGESAPKNGDYRLEVIDDTGGVDLYPNITLTDLGPQVMLKGSFASSGGGGGGGDTGGGDTGGPAVEPIAGVNGRVLTGNVIITPSSRPDLVNINVITGKDERGIWRYIIRDTATGDFPNKRYRGVDGKTWITKDQLHALNPYLWFTNVVVASEDSDPRDNKAHASQQIKPI